MSVLNKVPIEMDSLAKLPAVKRIKIFCMKKIYAGTGTAASSCQSIKLPLFEAKTLGDLAEVTKPLM